MICSDYKVSERLRVAIVKLRGVDCSDYEVSKWLYEAIVKFLSGDM